jgi:hypothetical protein
MEIEINHNIYNDNYIYWKQSSDTLRLGENLLGNILITGMSVIFLNDIFIDVDNYFNLYLYDNDYDLFDESILTLSGIVKGQEIILPISEPLNEKGYLLSPMPFGIEIYNIVGTPLNIYPFEIRLYQYVSDYRFGD